MSGITKVGLDDYLVAHGPEALADLLTEGDPLKVYDYRRFLRLRLPYPEPIIDGMIRRGEVGCIYGPSGVGKSFIVVEACRAVASGGALFGKIPCEQGGAVLVEQESSHVHLQERLYLLNWARPMPKGAASLSIIPMQALTFDNEEARALLRAHIEEVRPALLVVDTVVATIGNTDMNRAEQVHTWMNYFRMLANDFGLAVLLVAHAPKWADGREPKLESIFASVDFGASVDCAFAVSRVTGQRDTFRVATTKERWGGDAEKLDITISVGCGPHGGLILTSAEAAETVRQVVLGALVVGEWVAGKDVAKAVVAAHFSDRAARDELGKLVADHQVEEREGKGRGHPKEYRVLVEEGA